MKTDTKTERQTIQKSIILEHLKKIKTHPSAEQVYIAVKRKMPNISKGTVYRVLNNFKEKGQIQEIPSDVARYDGDNSLHAHFICLDCGSIADIYEYCAGCSVLKKTKKKVGEIKYYQMHFYGKCKKCEK